MKTTVVNIKKKHLQDMGYTDLQDWLKNPNHLYIGRNMSFYVKGANESKWKNPYSVKKYGLDKCLELYKDYIKENKDLLKDLDELDGKVLGCWCKPNKCHGDILIDLIERQKS